MPLGQYTSYDEVQAVYDGQRASVELRKKYKEEIAAHWEGVMFVPIEDIEAFCRELEANPKKEEETE